MSRIKISGTISRIAMYPLKRNWHTFDEESLNHSKKVKVEPEDDGSTSVTVQPEEYDLIKVKLEPEESSTSVTVKSGKNVSTSVKIEKEALKQEQKIKVLILLSYSGKSSFGVKRMIPKKKKNRQQFEQKWHNPESKVEREILYALLKAGAISNNERNNPELVCFQTAVHTMHGISAARNFISLIIPEGKLDKCLPKSLNSFLSPDVKVFAIKTVPLNFNPGAEISSLTYSYFLPTFALAPTAKESKKDYRINATRMRDVKEFLKNNDMDIYNYVNRSYGIGGPGYRIIQSCECTSTFQFFGLEFCLIKVKINNPQSKNKKKTRKHFHFVKQAVALMLNSLRNGTSLRQYLEEYDYFPAPPINHSVIMVEEPHYECYNEKICSQSAFGELKWVDFDESIEKFRREQICPKIAEVEYKDKVMQNWVAAWYQRYFESIFKQSLLQSEKDRFRAVYHISNNVYLKRNSVKSNDGEMLFHFFRIRKSSKEEEKLLPLNCNGNVPVKQEKQCLNQKIKKELDF